MLPYKIGYNAMAFVPTPNGVEVTFKGTQNDIPVVNVFHLDVHTSPDVTLLTDVLDVFGTWVASSWLTIMHTSYVLNQIIAKDISVVDGEEVALNLTADNTGEGTGAPTAANAALVASWRTIKTGRSFRGRTYIGALSNAVLNDAQNVTLLFAGGVADLMTGLLEALDAAGYTLCVLSKYALGVARVAGLLTEIIGVVVDTKVDSQRRRTAN
jgi:hypothetical protein